MVTPDWKCTEDPTGIKPGWSSKTDCQKDCVLDGYYCERRTCSNRSSGTCSTVPDCKLGTDNPGCHSSLDSCNASCRACDAMGDNWCSDTDVSNCCSGECDSGRCKGCRGRLPDAGACCFWTGFLHR